MRIDEEVPIQRSADRLFAANGRKRHAGGGRVPPDRHLGSHALPGIGAQCPPTESAERMDAGPLLRGPGVWRWRPRGQALAELVATATEGRG